MISIKNKIVLGALIEKQYDPNLFAIINDILSLASDIVITEGWRKGTGVHSMNPCRGIDLRSWIYTADELKTISQYINEKWIYDQARHEMRCLIVHDVGNGAHIHIQVHKNTKRLKKEYNV